MKMIGTGFYEEGRIQSELEELLQSLSAEIPVSVQVVHQSEDAVTSTFRYLTEKKLLRLQWIK